ncbi:MAG: GNAT family N-acetyltransferase [Thermoflexales bacterium]|nr:GNAT family N-acetyltransferase [Thermoflexales bacterium]
MDREIIAATTKYDRVLRALFELYAHDLSPMTGADVDEHGAFTDEDFPATWRRSRGDAFHPFLLRVQGAWAGFAFVGEGSYIRPSEDRHWLMEEFFILRKYRGQGLGRWFAVQLFDRFPGVWEVGEIYENTDAQAFWRRVIGCYTGGRFEEVLVDNAQWSGPVQRFLTIGSLGPSRAK